MIGLAFVILSFFNPNKRPPRKLTPAGEEGTELMGAERPPTGHDVELAALAAVGDRRAFGELVRRHGSAVRACCAG